MLVMLFRGGVSSVVILLLHLADSIMSFTPRYYFSRFSPVLTFTFICLRLVVVLSHMMELKGIGTEEDCAELARVIEM